MNNAINKIDQSLKVIKDEGPQTIKALAKNLDITVEGIRFKLLKLSKQGFVQSENQSHGRGRPKQVWSLTKKGHALFPNAHSKLSLKLIQKIKSELGEEALNKIIDSTSKDNIDTYLKQIDNSDSLEDKVKKLSKARDREGYMAGYEKRDDGSFILMENHCPICDAAKACQGFCKAELNTFKTVMGKGINVKRTKHILKGAKRCAYVIAEREPYS